MSERHMPALSTTHPQRDGRAMSEAGGAEQESSVGLERVIFFSDAAS